VIDRQVLFPKNDETVTGPGRQPYNERRTTTTSLAARAARGVFGEVDRTLRGVVASAIVSTLAVSAFWTFVGIWAVKELRASSAEIGIVFLLDALAAAASGNLSGHASDRVGRRRMIVWSWGALAIVVLAFIAVGDHKYVGFALVVLASAAGTPAWTNLNAIVADLVPPERQETSYATLRVANNLGVVCGPPIAGLLLLAHDWRVFFAGIAALIGASFVVGSAAIPRHAAYVPDEPPTRSSFKAIRQDRVFLAFVGSTVLAYVVYFAIETALPISAVQTYGLSPSTWGFVLVINPVLVTLFQIRVTRLVAPVSAAVKLLVAMPLMGFPFLLLPLSSSVPTIALVIVLFVIGEMLWAPTSQTIAARMAPADIRGAYMGAYGSASSIAFALGPFAALQLRGAFGDSAMWAFFAAISVVAAVVGAAACRLASGAGEAAAART
jgi:predicted MFS family arabinose efflux permease